MLVVQNGSGYRGFNAQGCGIQGQDRAAQHNRVIQGIGFWPWRPKMEYPHTGRKPPLQPIHDGVKLCIGIDLRITVPDVTNAVLENVIDHLGTRYAHLPAVPTAAARYVPNRCIPRHS